MPLRPLLFESIRHRRVCILLVDPWYSDRMLFCAFLSQEAHLCNQRLATCARKANARYSRPYVELAAMRTWAL